MTKWTLPDNYYVTENGRVFSMHSHKELRQTLNSHGYPSVRITVGGQRKRIAVHRLIAAEFHGLKPSDKHEIRHLNGDKTDNRAVNLCWGTRKDNANDREKHGNTVRGENHPRAKLTEANVREIRRRRAEGEAYTLIAKRFGVTAEAVRYAAIGHSWRTI